MKKFPLFLSRACVLLLLILAGCIHFSFAHPKKIRVLIVSGGHGFERKPFYNVFDSIPSITYDTLVQPQANVLIASSEVNKYDVLVFYDMFDTITPIQQDAYIDLLKKECKTLFRKNQRGTYDKIIFFYCDVNSRQLFN